jgi:hypothetical protein
VSRMHRAAREGKARHPRRIQNRASMSTVQHDGPDGDSKSPLLSRALTYSLSPGDSISLPGDSNHSSVYRRSIFPSSRRRALGTAYAIKHFAAGGTVPPVLRRGDDTVPAMLTLGEVVSTPDSRPRHSRRCGRNSRR